MPSTRLETRAGWINGRHDQILDAIKRALIEGIRKRPINVRFLEYVQTACALLIIGFMLYVTFYDVLDLRPQKAGPPPEEMSFTPSPSQSPQP